VGANGKLVPAWGRRCQTVSFAGYDFQLDFFLAAVATPIIGMDFLAKFELSIIPAKLCIRPQGVLLGNTMDSSVQDNPAAPSLCQRREFLSEN
jgi:hypothetical protein